MKRFHLRTITTFLVIYMIGHLLPAQDRAEADDESGIKKIFREALFAEEVESDLEAAQKGYTEVLKHYAEQKKLAATANFRLAEVYRKLSLSEPAGKYENRAVQEYEKVIREFPDMVDLVKLSRANLTAMGRALPEMAEASNEETRIIEQLQRWKETSPDKLAETPTPLYQAAKSNQLRVAKYLIDQGVDLEKDTVTPLTAAAGAGHLSMVELLFKAGADPRPKGSQPAIHSAILHDRMAIVQWLIQKGAHLKVVDPSGNPPLHAMFDKTVPSNTNSSFKSAPKILKYTRLLFDTGTPVNEVNAKTGKSLLHLASRLKFDEMVDLLLEHDANIDLATTSEGETPLLLATWSRDLSIIEKLLTAGANPNLADNSGYAPIHVAIVDDRNKEIVEALLAAGADVTQRISKDGWTPLHFWANKPRDEEIGRMLYRAGANPIALANSVPKAVDTRSLDFEKNTPLHILMDRKRNDSASVREFFEHGIQTLPSRDFEKAVWFVMPPGINSNPNPETEKAPTDLVPNLYPIYLRGPGESPPPGLADFIIQSFDDPYGNTKQKFPNLEKFRILRPIEKPEGKAGWETINVFYKDLAEVAKPGSDPALQWGDVILFDLETDKKTGDWNDFDEPIKLFLSQSSRVAIHLQFADLNSLVSFLPKSDYHTVGVPGDYETPFNKWSVRNITNIKRFATYRDDLDFTSVKIIRSRNTGDQEFTLELDPKASREEFYLQDNDRVIVPRKPDFKCVALNDRMNAIWVTQPGTHIYRKAVFKSSFEGREVAAIPLARVVAKLYDFRSSDAFPHPEFSKIHLKFPGSGNVGNQIVSLSNDGKKAIPWGTIVEIPMKEGETAKNWTGLTEEERSVLANLSRVSITIEPEGMQPRKLVAGYTFPKYKRIATGELLEERQSGSISSPIFWDVLGDQFRGKDLKWESTKIILKAADKQWTFSDQKVPDLLDGDTIQIFKAL